MDVRINFQDEKQIKNKLVALIEWWLNVLMSSEVN